MFDSWTVQDAMMFFFPIIIMLFVFYMFIKSKVRGLTGFIVAFLNVIGTLMIMNTINPDPSLRLIFEAYAVTSSIIILFKSLR
ncbi:hypothetical protein TEU_03295 [Thermococcus eurythermalis]|uniref:Uncharacterized protein n=1 Tax=Thermococcus eurythermalis TaxID=1505907 RepID=A0A097QSL8_9EURY|nr:hypothetical protein TEU_03295 [Thermococcus eurythermalis]